MLFHEETFCAANEVPIRSTDQYQQLCTPIPWVRYIQEDVRIINQQVNAIYHPHWMGEAFVSTWMRLLDDFLQRDPRYVLSR